MSRRQHDYHKTGRFYGTADPAVSFVKTQRTGPDEDLPGPRARDWIDIVGNRARAGRFSTQVRYAHQARPTSTFEPDYDEDPADRWRSRRPVDEWPSPIDRPGYPNVQISDLYRARLAIATRWLEYDALRLRGRMTVADALVLLAVEYDLESEGDVIEALAWMGIDPRDSQTRAPKPHHALKVSRAPNHGTQSEYQRGCRCPACREGARLHRAKKAGRDPATIKRYETKFDRMALGKV